MDALHAANSRMRKFIDGSGVDPGFTRQPKYCGIRKEYPREAGRKLAPLQFTSTESSDNVRSQDGLSTLHEHGIYQTHGLSGEIVASGQCFSPTQSSDALPMIRNGLTMAKSPSSGHGSPEHGPPSPGYPTQYSRFNSQSLDSMYRQFGNGKENFKSAENIRTHLLPPLTSARGYHRKKTVVSEVRKFPVWYELRRAPTTVKMRLPSPATIRIEAALEQHRQSRVRRQPLFDMDGLRRESTMYSRKHDKGFLSRQHEHSSITHSTEQF